LAFDLIASSHFHVIEYVDVNAMCAGMEIYSSQTVAWIYKESEWGEHTDVTFYSSQTKEIYSSQVCTLWGTLGSTL
jgi:hypothetical protein